MTTDEIKEALSNLFSNSDADEIDDSQTDGIESPYKEASVTDGTQDFNPEDTQSVIDGYFAGLIEKLDNRDKETLARIDTLEKKLNQVLTKSPATSKKDDAAQSEQEEYIPLLELDFATPAPKQ